MTVKEFTTAFRNAVGSDGPLSSPIQLLMAWESFVEQCEKGYDENFDEYDFDLQVRAIVERVLRDEDVMTMSEVGWFVEGVMAADKRFEKLLLPDPVRAGEWWFARIPAKSGAEMADDVLRRFGPGLTAAS